MKRVQSIFLFLLVLSMTGSMPAQGTGYGSGRCLADLGALTQVEGTVVAVNMVPGAGFPTFTVQVAAGAEVVIQTGPYWYFDTNGFTLSVADRVAVNAFASTDPAVTVYYAAFVANLTTGLELQFRDDDGRPLWTGGHNFKGNGSGSGGQNASTRTGSGQNRGHGGGQPGAGQGSPSGLDLAAMTEVHGAVTTVSFALGQRRSSFTLQATDGPVYTVTVGPLWYLAANEFTLRSGDVASVVMAPSLTNPGEWVAFQIRDETTGATIVLRDEEGFPLWRANL